MMDGGGEAVAEMGLTRWSYGVGMGRWGRCGGWCGGEDAGEIVMGVEVEVSWVRVEVGWGDS